MSLLSRLARVADAALGRCRCSYSQCGEDQLVRHVFDSLGVVRPTYLDIGAGEPFLLNNTAYFYRAGSRGINVEPNPVRFQRLAKLRPRDVNVQAGVLDAPGEAEFFRMSDDGFGGFSREHAEELEAKHGMRIVERIRVPVTTVGEILARHAGGRGPDFLSLDAEGAELRILRSIDFAAWSPTVVCCETISYSDTGQGHKAQDVVEFLQSKGYFEYADTNINTIFVLARAWKRGS